MAQRGIVPTVEMGWAWTPDGAMAMAKTLQEAGQSVYLLIPKVDLIEEPVWKDCKVWGEGPDATRKGQVRKWPCLPLADGKAGAKWLAERLQPYKDAGIRVSGVWFDDESLPHPWNGVFEAQKRSDECRRHYPPGTLDNFQAFRQYTDSLRMRLISEVMADPVHELFPGAGRQLRRIRVHGGCTVHRQQQ